jgi:hypothetical protein
MSRPWNRRCFVTTMASAAALGPAVVASAASALLNPPRREGYELPDV